MSGNRLIFTDSLGWANVSRYDGTAEWRKVWNSTMHRIHLVPRLATVDLPSLRLLAATPDGWTTIFEVPFLDELTRSAFVCRLRSDFPTLCAKFGYQVGNGLDFNDAANEIESILGRIT